MTEYDNIVVAAQEHAAKHAGALYSPVQKNGRCFIGRAFGFYAFYKSYISRLRYRYSWVRKVSSVIQMGLKLAVEILEDSGYMNTAVLPVATLNHK
jgi:hypothetical protein